MSQVDSEQPRAPTEPAPAPAAPTWERPRLQRIGNLRDLVGKSGPLPDNPGPNPERP